ncbi:ATP synthase subunit [Trichinella spiralis]|uniref:ATP synthase subunit n=1 Tax=Trichinella spiralis TaxID=6334 RepID=A0ABR3KK29_TRISP
MGKESTVSRLDDSDSNAAQNMNDEDEPAETSAPVCEDLRMACNLPPPGAISSSEGSCNDSQNLVRQLRRRFSRQPWRRRWWWMDSTSICYVITYDRRGTSPQVWIVGPIFVICGVLVLMKPLPGFTKCSILSHLIFFRQILVKVLMELVQFFLLTAWLWMRLFQVQSSKMKTKVSNRLARKILTMKAHLFLICNHLQHILKHCKFYVKVYGEEKCPKHGPTCHQHRRIFSLHKTSNPMSQLGRSNVDKQLKQETEQESSSN